MREGTKEAIEKAKGEQPWREFIKNSAKLRVLELHNSEGVNIISIAFNISNNFVYTFDMPVQIDLETIVIKVSE